MKAFGQVVLQGKNCTQRRTFMKQDDNTKSDEI